MNKERTRSFALSCFWPQLILPTTRGLMDLNIKNLADVDFDQTVSFWTVRYKGGYGTVDRGAISHVKPVT
jgi:hypothetical protein